MQPNRTSLLILSAVALVFLRGNGCGPDILENPGFDLWCGEQLCGWSVDDGEIKRVSTWHDADYGVALVGENVQLSQLANLSEGRPGCFEFDLLVDKGENADVFLEMDFQDDGSSEYSHTIPAHNWTPVRYTITPPSWYSSVRFILRKRGPDRVVLAQIRVRAGGVCLDDPLELVDRPLAAPCESNAQCSSSKCVGLGHAFEYYVDLGRACSECQRNLDCAPGEVCGAMAGEGFGAYYACGPAGRHALGERCITDEECATGDCCFNVCSECCSDADCGGRDCAPRDWQPLGESYEVLALPHQCAAGQGTGASDAFCLFDDDCQSGSCAGADALCLCAFEGWLCEAKACEPICFTEDECDERKLPLGKKGGICE